MSQIKTKNPLRLIARIWSVPIIAYCVMMLVGYGWDLVTIGTADPYAVEDVSFLESLPPILMFISSLTLALAFRRERLGGWVTLALQLAIIILLFVENPTFDGFPRRALPYILVLIISVPAVLFIVSSRRTHEHSS